MRWYYKYGLNDWTLLPIARRQHNAVIQYINKPSACAVPINRPLYTVLRQGLSPVPKTLERFEDMSDGDDLNGRDNWTVTTSGTNTIKAEETLPVSTMEGIWIKQHYTGSDSCNAKFTFPNASPQIPSATYQYIIKTRLVITGVTQYTTLQINGTNVSLTTGNIVVVFNPNGDIENYVDGVGYVDTGLDWAINTDYIIRITITSATTYTLGVYDQYGYMIAQASDLACSITFAAAVTSLWFISGADVYYDDIIASWDTESIGWDEDNTDVAFMKVVVTPDDVTATMLDADFDACDKLVLYKVTGMRNFENNCYLDLEEWHAQLWRDVHAEADNVVETVYITDITDTSDNNKIQCVTTSGGSTPPAWTANQHVNRGMRITAKKPSVPRETNQDGSPTVAHTGSLYGGYPSGTISNADDYVTYKADRDSDASFYAEYYRSDPPADPPTLSVTVHFSIMRCPSGKYQFRTKFGGYSGRVSGNGTVLTNGRVELVNYAGGDNLVLRDNISGLSPGASYVYDPLVVDNDLEYYDFENEVVSLKFVAPVVSWDFMSDIDYEAFIKIFHVYLEYDLYYPHDPVEYKIESNTAEDGSPTGEITIVEDAGVYDTAANRINHDDTVDILYTEKEWMEDHVVLRAMDVGAITCASTAATTPTYGLKRNKFVRNDISSIMDRNTLYAYLSRATSSRLPTLHLVDRASPTFHGGSVYPRNMMSPLPAYNVNFLQKVRSVTIDNTVLDAMYPADAPTLSDYPPIVSTRKEVPDAYLSNMAAGIWAGRDTVTAAINTMYLKSICMLEEDFMIYNDGDDPTVDNVAGWTAEAGDDHDNDAGDVVVEIDVTSGVHSLYFKDALGQTGGTVKQLIDSYTLPVGIVEGKVLRIKIKPVTCTGGSANCFLGIQINEDTTVGVHLGVLLTSGLIYYSTDDTETTTTDMTTTGKTATLDSIGYIWVKMENIGTSSTFKIAYTTNSTDTPSYSSAFAMATDLTMAIDTLLLYTPDANDDGGGVVSPDTGIETFADLDEDENVNGYAGDIGTYTVAAGTATALGHIDGSTHVLEITDDTDAESITLNLDLDEAGAIDGTESFEFKVKVPTKSGTNLTYFGMSEGTTVRIQFQLQADGDLFYYSGSFQDTGANLAVDGSETTIEILMFSTTQFKIRVNGGSWSAALNNVSSWSGAGSLCDRFWIINSGDGQSVIYFYDLKPSWMYEAGGTVYTSKTLEAYIYELWSDVLGQDANGDVAIHDIPASYFHVGCALDVHMAPTTKTGTDSTKHAYRQVIKQLEWLDTNDGVKIDLGFDDASRTSIEEARDRAFQRLLDPASQGGT